MKETNNDIIFDEAREGHLDKLPKENGLSHKTSYGAELDKWNDDYTVTCNICLKQFRSNSTLLAHVWSPRHRWKREQLAMTSKDNLQNTTTEWIKEEDMMLFKEEAIACKDHDPNKAILLLSKAGKGFARINEIDNAKECFQQVLELAEQFLKDWVEEPDYENEVFDDIEKEGSRSDENLENDIDNNNRVDISNDLDKVNNNTMQEDDTNNNGTNKDNIENEDEFRERSQTRPRIKRFKMEQMNKMYSNYKLQRGTADLYETMVQCYAESFDIDLGESAEQSENGQRQSLKVSEILMNRDLVLKELADTEKTYVDSLEFLVQNIIPEFKNSESQVAKDIIQGVFANIDEIYEWHRNVFFDKIEDCLEDHELLGPTFKEHEKELTNLYEIYCQNKPRADDLLIQYAEEIDQVYQNIDTSFTILDYLIKPVQRIMKYQLLLQSIVKYTKKMGETTDSMQAALEVMEIVPKKVNDKMHLAMIIGYTKSLERDQLVLQDTLNVSFGGGKTKPREYRVFLFNEFLLFTEPLKRPGRLPQYRFHLELKTCRMGVTHTVKNDKLKFAIWSRKFKTTDIYVCMADTQDMKESWLAALGNVLSIYGGNISKDSIKQESKPSVKAPVRTKTWSAEQIVRQATVGHPREYSMSSKLKANIHKFLMEELYLNAPETYCDDDSENNNDNNSSENGVQGTKAYLKNDSKNRINSTEKVESSSDESIKSDDDKCTCDKSSRHNSLRSIEEEVGSNSKKGFKLWKSIKDKRTLFGKKSNSQRSMSLPDSIMKKSMDDFEVIEESVNNSDNAQIEERKIFQLKSVAAEVQFLLVQNEASLSWEDAEQLLDKSLGLFFDVKRLKQFSEEERDPNSLLKISERHYRNLKQKQNFGDYSRDSNELFYSYRGLFELLVMYADLSSGSATSFWPILLYTMAIAAARVENNWNDAFIGYKKLSQIYKIRKMFEFSVDCLVEAYQIELSLNDVSTAASCLKDALETALIAGNKVKCQILETMATKLLEKSQEMGIETPSLKLITEMSFAYKRQDYSWFNDNYYKIWESENYLENQDKSEFKELFMHLLEHLKERRQKLSGEVFV